MASDVRQVTPQHHALPDKPDARDHAYRPAPDAPVPPQIPLEPYLDLRLPMLDQGDEHACTGFALATVVHYLMRRHPVAPDPTPVSPRMLYEMAKRCDEWKGTDYPGSSARGAIKGWHKHGVCAFDLWPYVPDRIDRRLTRPRREDARRRPLGLYRRVDKTNLFHMCCALAECGIVYATANVHMGWRKAGADGVIAYPDQPLGSHAFAIVGRDDGGFWLQNSVGPGWGRHGFGYLSFPDWLANAQDAWVTQLAPAAAP